MLSAIIVIATTALSQEVKKFNDDLLELKIDEVSSFVPEGYIKVFENKNYSYFKNNKGEVIAFNFVKSKLKSIVFTDKYFVTKGFEKRKTDVFNGDICLLDTRYFVVAKNGNEYILFNKFLL